MVTYVVNIREDQYYKEKCALHLPRVSLKAAIEAADQPALLYASSREQNPGYFATAIIGEAIPDPDHPNMYWLPLYDRQPLSRTVTAEELRAIGIDEMPFHIYSRPIRPVQVSEHEGLSTLGVYPTGFADSAAQTFEFSPSFRQRQLSVPERELRFQMFDVYGPKCIFLRRSYPSLDRLNFGTDVGHFLPRWAGGPDSIQNVGPMSKDVNNQWDQGLISLTNSGNVLIAHQAGPDTRALFSSVTRIAFPKDPRFWPNASFLEKHRDTIFERGPCRRRGRREE